MVEILRRIFEDESAFPTRRYRVSSVQLIGDAGCSAVVLIQMELQRFGRGKFQLAQIAGKNVFRQRMSSQIFVIRKALFTKRTFERPFVQMDVAYMSLHAVFGFEQFPAIAAAEFPVDVNLAFVTD